MLSQEWTEVFIRYQSDPSSPNEAAFREAWDDLVSWARRQGFSPQDAEDSAQDSFAKIVPALKNGKFRQKPRGNGKAWASRILANGLKSAAKKRRRERDRLDCHDSQNKRQQEPSKLAAPCPDNVALTIAMSTLTPEQKFVIEGLRNGLPAIEIERLLGMSRSRVRTIRAKAERILNRELTNITQQSATAAFRQSIEEIAEYVREHWGGSFHSTRRQNQCRERLCTWAARMVAAALAFPAPTILTSITMCNTLNDFVVNPNPVEAISGSLSIRLLNAIMLSEVMYLVPNAKTKQDSSLLPDILQRLTTQRLISPFDGMMALGWQVEEKEWQDRLRRLCAGLSDKRVIRDFNSLHSQRQLKTRHKEQFDSPIAEPVNTWCKTNPGLVSRFQTMAGLPSLARAKYILEVKDRGPRHSAIARNQGIRLLEHPVRTGCSSDGIGPMLDNPDLPGRVIVNLLKRNRANLCRPEEFANFMAEFSHLISNAKCCLS